MRSGRTKLGTFVTLSHLARPAQCNRATNDDLTTNNDLPTTTLSHLAATSVTTLLLLISANVAFAREWRGIVPLRSTRADVVRLLNQCADQREACRFTVGTEDVHILFSGGLTAEHPECASGLTPETVMLIDIEPLAKLKLRDLGLNRRHLTYFDGSDPPYRDFKGYSTNDGLLLTLFKDKVLRMIYVPAQIDAGPCSHYYQRPESFAEVRLVHVPVIHKLEAEESIKAGEKLKVTAYSDINDIRGYTWTTDFGTIIAGQYTKEVTIDTTGLEGQTITVTAEISDPLHHAAFGSCRVRILPK